MKKIRKTATLAFETLLVLCSIEIAAIVDVPGFGSSAEARGGRPLTPVSVAGVGRSTVRRCAADVYSC